MTDQLRYTLIQIDPTTGREVNELAFRFAGDYIAHVSWYEKEVMNDDHEKFEFEVIDNVTKFRRPVRVVFN